MLDRLKMIANQSKMMYLPGFQALMLRETKITTFVLTIGSIAYIILVDVKWYLDLMIFVMTCMSFLSGVFMGQSEAVWDRWYIRR